MSIRRRSQYELWYGRDEPPRKPRTLRAGPVLVELHGPDLRYARTERNEVVRRIYVAVRDLNWNTLNAEVGEPEIEDRNGEFQVRVAGQNAGGEIDFSWRVLIEGTRDGSISYEMDGTARTAFAFAKIGLCVHHPIRESAGRLFRGVTPRGPVGGELPRNVGPQIHLFDEGWDLPLFEPAEWFEIDLPHGEQIRFDFEGDLFEMEDHRNWTDASFKTASTPASLGYHHTIGVGGLIRQKVTFRVKGTEVQAPRPRGKSPASLIVGEPIGRLVPPVGLGSASHGQPLSARELDLLQILSPAHLRVDVRPRELEVLKRGLAEARALGCALELALFVNDDASFVAAVVEILDGSDVIVARILVFDDSREVSPVEQVDIVRSRISGVPVGGGTNVHFTELNRNRPDPDRLDVIGYSVTPQIHAFDELSLVEALEGQGETVRAARAFSGDAPIAVTPITLRPRFNAFAVVEEPAETGRLPRQVDPRQMSLFGAAWTVGSVKNLAEAGTTSLTYFETSGWRGVVERDQGSDNPAFPSQPGEPFPLYHVLARVCAWRGAELVDCIASNPLCVTALGVRQGGHTSLLLANLDHVQRTVRIEPQVGSASKIELGPYEVAELDA